MAAEDAALEDVMKLLQTEPEPSSGPAGGLVPTAPGPEIPALREQLAVLVSTGKAKEAIGVQLTHEQVKRLSDKDVEKYTKRYETYVGSKTTESLIDSFIFLATKTIGMFVNIKDLMGISVWVLTQKMTGITASFRENVAAIVLFYTPSAKTTKAIFDDYAGELSQDKYKGLISKLKERKFSYLVFSLRHPYGVKLF